MRKRAWSKQYVGVLLDEANVKFDLFAMKRYHRVFAKALDQKTNWYAFNDSLDGYQANRNQEQNIVFKKLAGDVRQLKLEDVYSSDGNPAPFNWFDSGTRRRGDVVVVSTFAVLTMTLRKKQLDSELFSQGPLAHIQRIINTIAIENCVGIDISKDSGTNSTKDKSKIKQEDAKNASRDTERDQQAIHGKYKDFATIQRTPNSHLNTSQILNSRELTPPEKKRTIKAKGEMIGNAVKDIAHNFGEDVFSMFGNIASQDTKAEVADMLRGATGVMFYQLGAKNAITAVMSSECQSKLYASFRVPDWVYVLTKVRLRISDAGWQSLLNLTQLGRTGVSFISCFVANYTF